MLVPYMERSSVNFECWHLMYSNQNVLMNGFVHSAKKIKPKSNIYKFHCAIYGRYHRKNSGADLRDASGAPTLRLKIFSISCSFSENWAKWPPPKAILDPPLQLLEIFPDSTFLCNLKVIQRSFWCEFLIELGSISKWKFFLFPIAQELIKTQTCALFKLYFSTWFKSTHNHMNNKGI